VLDMRFSPEFDAGGKVASVLGVSRDITERKRIEEDLRASESKFSSIFHLSPDAIDLTELETGVSPESRQVV